MNMNMRTKKTLVIFAALAVVIFAGCRERIVWTGPGDWLLLATDPDDGGVTFNGHYLYVDADFSDNVLEFKMETWGTIPNAQDSVLMAVYFDTDQNASTGLSASTPDFDTDAKPQSIGAEFMMFVGSERTDAGPSHNNVVFQWNPSSTPPGWDSIAVTTNLYQPVGGDSVRGAISEATLGNPSAVDVEVLFICNVLNPLSEYRDRVPDGGHATIDLAADSIIPASSTPAILLSIPADRTNRSSLVTGKPRDLGEAR